MDIFVLKTSTCFKGSYSLIVLYSRTVSNCFESKSDIYSPLIDLRSIYLYTCGHNIIYDRLLSHALLKIVRENGGGGGAC